MSHNLDKLFVQTWHSYTQHPFHQPAKYFDDIFEALKAIEVPQKYRFIKAIKIEACEILQNELNAELIGSQRIKVGSKLLEELVNTYLWLSDISSEQI